MITAFEDSFFDRVLILSTLVFYSGVLIWLGWTMFKEEYLTRRNKKG